MDRDSREVTDSPSKLFFLNIFYLPQNVCLLEFQKPEGKSMRVRVCWDSRQNSGLCIPCWDHHINFRRPGFGHL